MIMRHCNASNAAALACEATFYQATTLKLSVFDYIISCMETMLESGLLDDMDDDVLLDLCRVISDKQSRKLSVSRSGTLVSLAMDKHREWLALQDIPVPRVRQPWKWRSKSPLISPTDPVTRKRADPRSSRSPVTSPEMLPTPMAAVVDDIFSMDDVSVSSPSAPSTAQTPKSSRPMTPLDIANSQSSKGPVWKSRTVEIDR